MLPKNTAKRLCKLYGVLQSIKDSHAFISSKELAIIMGTTDYTVRKDISMLNLISFTKKGYPVAELATTLGRELGLSKSYRACVVGLGRLGTALLDYEAFKNEGFEIVAGFDSNINKVERLLTTVSVYSSKDMEHIIRSQNIEIAIIAVPQLSAQEVATSLAKSGIKGIVNFSSIQLKVPRNVVLYNMDFTTTLRFVVSQI